MYECSKGVICTLYSVSCIYFWSTINISAWYKNTLLNFLSNYFDIFKFRAYLYLRVWLNENTTCRLSLFSAGVKRACCDFLESQLDPSNCLGIRDFAETHNCLDLMQAAELFSQKHFSEVVQHEEFMLLSQTEVEKLIKCDEIQVRKLKKMT